MLSDRLMAARHYRELFAGEDTIEADAAASRIQMMVEGVNAYLQAAANAGKKSGR